MRLVPLPQTRRWLSPQAKEKVTVYRFDPASGLWYEIPNPNEESEISHTPQKKERHWLLTAIPLWIAVIAVTVFLCSERHLIAKTDEGMPIMDISYSIWGNQLNRVILYDQHGEKAATLNRYNGFGTEKLRMRYSSGDNDEVYMDIYYINLQPAARFEHYGEASREIYYAENGLVESLEETIDGRKIVYKFIQQQDESLGYTPDLVRECHVNSSV